MPALTQPVNDFANVIDPQSAAQLDGMIRSLQQASGDVVVVATVQTVAPFADAREYAVEMFENGGRGIGERGRDNGLLVLVAVAERRVEVEVGYDLEEFITDGFAGETARNFMAPQFARGDYGAGLVAGVSRLVGRIAERRNVSLEGVRPPQESQDEEGGSVVLTMFILFMLFNAIAGRMRRGRRRSRRWGGGGWSGWHSGVGPFGGGFGGGGGGGFGGGFGGFGGGRSGGGGGGAGW